MHTNSSRTISAKSIAIVTIAALAPSASAYSVVNSTQGPGGPIPDAPCVPACPSPPPWTSAPSWPALISPVSVPHPIDRVTAVQIQGLQHFWRGDLHVYLQNPAGDLFNLIVRPGFGGDPGVGDDGDILPGTYTIVEAGGASFFGGKFAIAPGTYNQYLNSGGGAWNNGWMPIANVPLGAISGSAGTWRLHLRDWYPTDTGSITGWTLHGENDGATGYCFGDGSTTACPCGNNGDPGHGCANSIFASGGFLAGYGTPSVSADSLELEAQHVSGNICVFLQGSAQLDATVIDDGLGCVGGSLIRLGTTPVINATSTYPQPANLPISIKGAVSPLGATRYYQTVYRNSAASFCPPAATNRTNGAIVIWTP